MGARASTVRRTIRLEVSLCARCGSAGADRSAVAQSVSGANVRGGADQPDSARDGYLPGAGIQSAAAREDLRVAGLSERRPLRPGDRNRLAARRVYRARNPVGGPREADARVYRGDAWAV